MKIIGITATGSYLAEIEHQEVEKVVDKYYGKLGQMKAGQSIDLGAGHDYREQIRSACSGMVDATARFERAQKTLMSFSLMASQLPDSFPKAEESTP